MINFTSAIPLVGSLWNHFLQSSQQSRSEDFAREMFGRQRDANMQMSQMMLGAQRWNMKNQASLNRSGMVQAGLNPNNPNGLFTTGGISPSTPTTSPTSATYNAPDTSGFSEFGKLVQNEPLVKAEARKLNADAEAQELVNKGTKEENAWYSNFDFIPSDKMEYDKDGNLVLGDVVSLPSSTRKGVEARVMAKKRIEAELAKLDNEEITNILSSKVANMQANTKTLYEAIANAPKNIQDQIQATISELSKKIELYGSQIALNDANKELLNLEKQYNVYGLLDSLRTHLSQFDIKEAFADIVTIALRGALSKIGVK